MTDLDIKLAILATMTGRSPLSIDEYHDHTLVSVECNGINCFGGCPFYDPLYRSKGKFSSCSTPKGNSPELLTTPIRTYQNAITNYPELFL